MNSKNEVQVFWQGQLSPGQLHSAWRPRRELFQIQSGEGGLPCPWLDSMKKLSVC